MTPRLVEGGGWGPAHRHAPCVTACPTVDLTRRARSVWKESAWLRKVWNIVIFDFGVLFCFPSGNRNQMVADVCPGLWSQSIDLISRPSGKIRAKGKIKLPLSDLIVKYKFLSYFLPHLRFLFHISKPGQHFNTSLWKTTNVANYFWTNI